MKKPAATTPTAPEMKQLLAKAIRLLDQELDLIEPGQRAELVKVLTELRHQVAALTALIRAQKEADALRSAVLDTIRSVDERLWLEVSARLGEAT